KQILDHLALSSVDILTRLKAEEDVKPDFLLDIHPFKGCEAQPCENARQVRFLNNCVRLAS
ncbi:hypothetical protein ACNJNR_24595, partial [Citrobacter portucalensis]